MQVTLREWQTGDEAAAVRWSRDRAFCQANGWTPELSAQQVREWWCERGEQAKYLRMIEVDGGLVGYAEWQDVQGGEAELGIAIGDSGLWGQGVGTQAGKQMLAWAFGELGLRRVWAEVHEPNARSLALMRRLGLREVSKNGTGEYQGAVVPMVQFELLCGKVRINRPAGE